MWWILTQASIDSLFWALLVHASTNIYTHLMMKWSTTKPTRVPVWRVIRGIRTLCGYYWLWHNPQIVEQNEAGDTIEHTFNIPALNPADTAWFYVYTEEGPWLKECQGPLMWGKSSGIVPHQELFRAWGNALSQSLERPGSAWTYGARRFEPIAAGNVLTVKVRMKSTSFAHNLLVHMQLRQDDGGEPSNFVQEESTTVFDYVPGAYAEYVFEFDGSTLVTPGNHYWVVMFRTDATYATVSVIAASTADTPGRFDKTGQQPWNPINREIDIIVHS